MKGFILSIHVAVSNRSIRIPVLTTLILIPFIVFVLFTALKLGKITFKKAFY